MTLHTCIRLPRSPSTENRPEMDNLRGGGNSTIRIEHYGNLRQSEGEADQCAMANRRYVRYIHNSVCDQDRIENLMDPRL